MPEQNTNESQCKHYWVIEPPNGPTSMGKCKYCGMVKEFINGSYIFIDGKPIFNINNTHLLINHPERD